LILPLNLPIATGMHRISLAFLAGVFLAGCQMFDAGLPDRVEPVAVVAPRLPTAAEEAIGAREDPRVVAEYGGVYSDPDVEGAVAKVVARLVAASDDPSRHYRITILNSPVANAFALPGGYLYITRGLIALTDDSSSPTRTRARAHAPIRSSILRPSRATRRSRRTRSASPSPGARDSIRLPPPASSTSWSTTPPSVRRSAGRMTRRASSPRIRQRWNGASWR
jgi:predicted Zn-dependent protease